jgi:hypothetical protein
VTTYSQSTSDGKNSSNENGEGISSAGVGLLVIGFILAIVGSLVVGIFVGAKNEKVYSFMNRRNQGANYDHAFNLHDTTFDESLTSENDNGM